MAKVSGTISVNTPVHHGETTTVSVTPGGENVYVFVRCYNPEFVYAAYFPVDSNGNATIGPLTSSLWASGGANAIAEEGYFRRDGFGRWVVLASTEFEVLA